MLKTNSKQAKENIKAYIMDGFTPENYGKDKDEFSGFSEIARFIMDVYMKEYGENVQSGLYKTHENAFVGWCQGLPSVLDTCYYYNRSAITDLGDILDETEDERNKYTEAQAEEMLTRLIYRELLIGSVFVNY